MTGLVLVLYVCTMLANFVCGLQRGDIRLVGGDSEYEGRVEIFLNGEWGTIDDDPWDNNDASVVCRQLGYTFGGFAYRGAHFGQGSGPIWLDSIGCTGREDNLLSCSYQTDTSEDSHSEDVGVACNGKVRLVNGNGPDEGRVEILKNGQWGTIDEDPWNDDDAGVVCRQLGYLHGGVAFRSAHFGQGTGPIWLDDIQCLGNEPDLMSCPHGTETTEDNHSEDVGVKCAWQVRLANGSLPGKGRVEVLINGRWGTIRDENWDNKEANVVCSQLGYPSGGIAYSGAYFGEGDGPVLLNNLKCTGTESSLFRCSHRKVSSDSRHSQDAGVACFDPNNDFCFSDPCANNGKCVNERTSFLCVCPTGFSGTRCENVIDPCDSNPCERNGLCVREHNQYRCICPDGVEGPQCEIDSDLCDSRDCQSSDNCVQRLNYRYCTCPSTSNITILCQYEVNACYNKLGKDTEICLLQGDSFNCVSNGSINFINVDPCDSHPCENNGLCIRERNDYRCICPDGVEGPRCEIDSDPCNTKDCKSSINCVQRLNYRYCVCRGISNITILCQYEADPCYSSPCNEKETCLSRGNGFDCVTVGKITSKKSEPISSYLSLILAICALLVTIVCLVKIHKIQQHRTLQGDPSAAVFNDDIVQINVQQNQNNQEEDSAIGYKKL